MKFERPLLPKEQGIEKSEIPASETESNRQEGHLEKEVMEKLNTIIESADEKIRPILRVNLELMTGDKKNQMISILTGESVGGNAGKYEDFPCAVANFYYDKNTGEISEFTDYPIKNKDLVEGSFRVTVDMLSKNPFFKIVEKYFSPKSSNDAMENLKRSVDLYNQKNVLEQEKSILNTNNFDELFEVLDKIGAIEGSRRFYSTKELKSIIEEIREGKSNLRAVTRTAGLRDKITELLEKTVK